MEVPENLIEQSCHVLIAAMSALPSKADMCSALAHVCFGPIADTRGDLSDDLDTRSVIAPIARNPFLAVQARLVVGA